MDMTIAVAIIIGAIIIRNKDTRNKDLELRLTEIRHTLKSANNLKREEINLKIKENEMKQRELAYQELIELLTLAYKGAIVNWSRVNELESYIKGEITYEQTL